MENLNTLTVSTKISHLVEHISDTADALISALEVNAQSIGSYGGGVVQHFDSEFADRVMNTLLKLKYHLQKLDKELENWLITSQEDLREIVGGLLQTVDQLDRIMLEDGFIRNNFAFFIDELKGQVRQLLGEIFLTT